MRTKKEKKIEPVNYRFIKIKRLPFSHHKNVNSIFYNDADLRVCPFYKPIIFLA